MTVLTKKDKNKAWYKRWLHKKDDELCENCGKPFFAHFNRNMEDGYCEPYGLDVSRFNVKSN